ncbi:hypothetical protein Tco_0150683 [Tanacetum coccineum]
MKTICTHRRCPLQEHPGSNEYVPLAGVPFKNTRARGGCRGDDGGVAVVGMVRWLVKVAVMLMSGGGGDEGVDGGRDGVTKIVLLGLESVPLTSRFVASEQDELPSSVGLDFRARLNGCRIGRGPLIMPRILRRFVTKLATDRLIDGSSCDEIDMVIKDLDLEPKIDVMMRDFLELVIQLKTMTVGNKQMLCNVLEGSNKAQEAKTVVLNGGTHTERRLLQMILEDRDFKSVDLQFEWDGTDSFIKEAEDDKSLQK